MGEIKLICGLGALAGFFFFGWNTIKMQSLMWQRMDMLQDEITGLQEDVRRLKRWLISEVEGKENRNA